MKHNETIKTEFAKQANRFGAAGHTLSSQEYLAWMVELLPLQSSFRVLDVASGTGHLSRAIAPHVKEVIAIDVTPEMLAEAQKEMVRSGLRNITLEEGNAAELPYHDNSFDMVVSRLAMHHFEKPDCPMQEMVRVCKPNHVVGIIDLLSPDDKALVEPYNRIEKLRDPSHAVALQQEQLVALMTTSGLTVNRIDTRDITVDFQRWIDLTETNQPTKAAIQEELELEINGGRQTGMRPYRDAGKLKFVQRWAIVIGTKFATEAGAGGAA